MQITKIKLYKIENELITPFSNAITEVKRRRTIIVEVQDENGSAGYGEVVTFQTPWYTEETTDGAWLFLKQFVLPRVKGHNYLHPSQFHEQMKYIKGNHMALAGVEMALWDLASKREDCPLYIYLGGQNKKVKVGIAIGKFPFEERCKKIQYALAKGYTRIKLKIDRLHALDELQNLRNQFPDAPFMVDFNGSCTKEDIPMLKALDMLNLQMIEQPFLASEWLLYHTLQNEIATPLCLDESIVDLSHIQLAKQFQFAKMGVVKLGRVGGYTNALKMHAYALYQNFPLWVGGMLESGIGRAHNLSLATLSGFCIAGDISDSKNYYFKDIIKEDMIVENGCMTVPDRPGIGFTVDKEALQLFSIETYEA